MPKTKRLRKVLNITMDPETLADLRKHCDLASLTYSGYIEDLVTADLDRRYPVVEENKG